MGIFSCSFICGEKAKWSQEITKSLPSGPVMITPENANYYRLTVKSINPFETMR